MSRIAGAKPEIDEHKADRENPHDVDDGQTGAADSLSNHESSTGGIHGVGDTDSVESESGAQSKVDDHENKNNPHSESASDTDLSNHAGSSSGVHGVGASNVESESGAQSKVDDHENKNNPHSASASTSHNNDEHSVPFLPESNYDPEADTHDRYTDGEAADAAPVQSVNGETGAVATFDPVRVTSGTVQNASWDLSSYPVTGMVRQNEVVISELDGSEEVVYTGLSSSGKYWVALNTADQYNAEYYVYEV